VDANTTVANAAPTTANVVANETPANAAPAANEVIQANVTPANETPPANATVETTESRAEKRIRQLVAKQRDAERDAEYWRGVAEGRAAGQPATPAMPGADAGGPSGPTPTPEQFESYDDFLYAEFKHRASKEAAITRQTQAQAEVHQKFMEKVNQEAEADPEILDILRDARFLPNSNPMSGVIASAIKESDVSPQIMRHLHKNQGELQKLYQMTPVAAAREIGKLEQRLLSLNKPEPVRKVSQAPEPIKTLEPKGSQLPDMEKIPMDDFVKKRNTEQFGSPTRR